MSSSSFAWVCTVRKAFSSDAPCAKKGSCKHRLFKNCCWIFLCSLEVRNTMFPRWHLNYFFVRLVFGVDDWSMFFWCFFDVFWCFFNVFLMFELCFELFFKLLRFPWTFFPGFCELFFEFSANFFSRFPRTFFRGFRELFFEVSANFFSRFPRTFFRGFLELFFDFFRGFRELFFEVSANFFLNLFVNLRYGKRDSCVFFANTFAWAQAFCYPCFLVSRFAATFSQYNF